MQRHDKISKGGERHRHDAEEDHDRPVHGAERIIELRRHFAVRHGIGAENVGQPFTDDRQRLTGIGQLPAHQHHQGKAKKQKDQATNSVLNADHLVIGGEDVFSPKTELVVLMFVPCFVMMFVVRFERSGSVHFEKKVSRSISKGKASLQSQKWID